MIAIHKAGVQTLALMAAFLVGALLGGATCFAADDPKACQNPLPAELHNGVELREHDPDIDRKHQPPVNFHKGQFDYRGKTYPFETFSATAQKNPRVGLWCFRNEVENLGASTIFDMGWDKLYYTSGQLDLAPQTRAIGRIDDYSIFPPDPEPTTLFAFENTPSDSQAYSPKNAARASANTLPKLYNLEQLAPDFWSSASKWNESKTVITFPILEENTSLPIISTSFAAGDFMV